MRAEPCKHRWEILYAEREQVRTQRVPGEYGAPPDLTHDRIVRRRPQCDAVEWGVRRRRRRRGKRLAGFCDPTSQLGGEELRAYPAMNRFGQVAGELVEPRDGLVPFEAQLQLPAEAVDFEELQRSKPHVRHSRNQHDVGRHLQHQRRDLGPCVLAVQLLTGLVGLGLGQSAHDQTGLDRVRLVRPNPDGELAMRFRRRDGADQRARVQRTPRRIEGWPRTQRKANQDFTTRQDLTTSARHKLTTAPPWLATWMVMARSRPSGHTRTTPPRGGRSRRTVDGIRRRCPNGPRPSGTRHGPRCNNVAYRAFRSLRLYDLRLHWCGFSPMRCSRRARLRRTRSL